MANKELIHNFTSKDCPSRHYLVPPVASSPFYLKMGKTVKDLSCELCYRHAVTCSCAQLARKTLASDDLKGLCHRRSNKIPFHPIVYFAILLSYTRINYFTRQIIRYQFLPFSFIILVYCIKCDIFETNFSFLSSFTQLISLQ